MMNIIWLLWKTNPDTVFTALKTSITFCFSHWNTNTQDNEAASSFASGKAVHGLAAFICKSFWAEFWEMRRWSATFQENSDVLLFMYSFKSKPHSQQSENYLLTKHILLGIFVLPQIIKCHGPSRFHHIFRRLTMNSSLNQTCDKLVCIHHINKKWQL